MTVTVCESDISLPFESLIRISHIIAENNINAYVVVDKDIPSKEIELKIKKKAGKLLQNITVFDLYEGKNIMNNKKSLAYSLTFSDPARTLQDEEINTIMENIISDLENSGMELRK